MCVRRHIPKPPGSRRSAFATTRATTESEMCVHLRMRLIELSTKSMRCLTVCSTFTTRCTGHTSCLRLRSAGMSSSQCSARRAVRGARDIHSYNKKTVCCSTCCWSFVSIGSVVVAQGKGYHDEHHTSCSLISIRGKQVRRPAPRNPSSFVDFAPLEH